MEQASLVRSKQLTASAFTTPSSTLSPSSSSLEGALRNAQALNTRALHQNASQGSIHELPMLSPGSRTSTGLAEPFLTQIRIHEHLISAVLGLLVFQLCRNSGFIPLNSRTLILMPTQALNAVVTNGPTSRKVTDILVATLDVSVTSLGSLVVKAHSDYAPSLQTLTGYHATNDWKENVVAGPVVWLAPGGTTARYCGFFDETTRHPVSASQDVVIVDRLNSLSAATIQSWQSNCREWLSDKGMDISSVENGGWVFVQVLGGKPLYSAPEHQDSSLLDIMAIVAWPAALCFQSARKPIHKETCIAHPRDPLCFAESWFSKKDERSEIMLKRQKDRQMAEALSKEQADVESRALHTHYSPVAMRRSSNSGAMYPTPPDALHHLIGATPTFDGAVSTPGHPHMYASNDGGNATAFNPPPTETDTDLWGSSEKKHRNSAPDAFNDNDHDNDNLFGDLEEGDFFGTDVTDADFSFFDQPDDLPLPNKPTSPTPGNLGIHNDVRVDSDLDFQMMNTDLPSDLHMEDFDSTMLEDTLPVVTHPPLDIVEAQVNVEFEEIKVEEEREDTLMKAPPPVSPPFNKETVFRQLFPSSVEKNTAARRSSTFNKIEFEKSLTSVNQKYDLHGQFNFLPHKGSAPSLKKLKLPTTDYLGRRRRASQTKCQTRLGRILVNESPLPVKQPGLMDQVMDSDESSQYSDQDDTSITTEEPSRAPIGLMNIWNVENNDSNSAASPLENKLTAELEHAANTPLSINDSHLLLLEADPADWPLIPYFKSPDPDIHSITLSDSERIASAQVLADQAVSGTLKVPGTPVVISSVPDRNLTTRSLIHSLASIAKGRLEGLAACTMKGFIDIQGIPVVQGLRLPPRPMPPQRGLSVSDLSRISNPFTILPPQLELKRSDAKISVLPSAVNFWDNLGLGPAKGTKDVAAVCVYPNTEGVALSANAFLDQMRSQYESCRLGTHERISSKELVGGLVSFAIDSSQQNKSHYLALLKETVGKLGRHLAAHAAEEKNLVVYFVYPNDDAQLLVHICSAFQHLFNLYRKALLEKKLCTSNELVLQLIPLDFIASPTAIIVQPSTQYARLAMEVYDRCINFASSSSTPAILLEQPLPKIIDFKLSIYPSASLLQENTCLHIAYAQSIDDRWITAAWTDNQGTQQMTASYCLGRKNEPLSMSFADIASEIWQTTLDYIGHKKIHWRIMIARIGVMDPSEVESWASLATIPTDNHTSLTLLAVKTDPSLCLLPNSITLPPNGVTAQSVVTPASTPQPSQSSIADASTPTRDTHASTPGENTAEPDSDSCLVDYTDQSWGAVLAHRLNNSNSLLDLNPALISGYLIKRGGTNLDDPPITMEVNVVYSDVVGNPRTFHESLMREVLGYYRGLGTLARVRGIVDPVLDCRPWHIAAAEKAVNALYMLM